MPIFRDATTPTPWFIPEPGPHPTPVRTGPGPGPATNPPPPSIGRPGPVRANPTVPPGTVVNIGGSRPRRNVVVQQPSGPVTPTPRLDRLREVLAQSSSAQDLENIQLLARLIFVAAAGEWNKPWARDAMEGVGWVVRNRVESPRYPYPRPTKPSSSIPNTASSSTKLAVQSGRRQLTRQLCAALLQ